MTRRERSRTDRPHVVVAGDALLDRTWSGTADRLCPDSAGPVIDLDELTAGPGGAALTAVAATAVASVGLAPARVSVVTAVGDDAPGDELRSMLGRTGVTLLELDGAGATPEKIRVRAAGATVARLDRASSCDPTTLTLTDPVREALRDADVVLLSDYGRGVTALVAHELAGSSTSDGLRRLVVWDPHPSSGRPPGPLELATPNLREARAALRGAGRPLAADTPPDAVAVALAQLWACTVAVTCGQEGVVVSDGGSPRWVPTVPSTGDACGAGDWFAATTAVALAHGVATVDALATGCRAAARWVAGAGRRDLWSDRSPGRTSRTDPARTDPARADPARTGTVVATSGCFDVLHVGHLSMLRHARSLGDRLVVLVNSDDSVRSLKGPGRPINDVHDRAALLAGLDCVDEVRIFDEATPCAALRRLRPDVFVKGADYVGRQLPEATVLAEWGGRIEFAPLVSGRSTTRVLRVARMMAG